MATESAQYSAVVVDAVNVGNYSLTSSLSVSVSLSLSMYISLSLSLSLPLSLFEND